MKIHIVQKGDTLWKIAKKYGVNFEELKKLNSQLSNPDMIMPGMKIKVPTAGGIVKKEMHHGTHNPGPGVKKEIPLTEHPFAKEKPIPAPIKEVPVKEVPIKEQPIIKEAPKAPYTPKMPLQVVPEIDINNYYMMNMQQMKIEQPQLPPKPANILPEVKEVPKKEITVPIPPPVQPVQEMPCEPQEYCVPITPIMPGPGFCPPFGGMGVPMQPYMPYPNYPNPGMAVPMGPGPGVVPAVSGPVYAPHHFDMESSSFMPQMPVVNPAYSPGAGPVGVPGAVPGTPMPYSGTNVYGQVPSGYSTLPAAYGQIPAEYPAAGYPAGYQPGYPGYPGAVPGGYVPGAPVGYPVQQSVEYVPGAPGVPGTMYGTPGVGSPYGYRPDNGQIPYGYPPSGSTAEYNVTELAAPFAGEQIQPIYQEQGLPIGTGAMNDCGCGAPPAGMQQEFIPPTPPIYSAPYSGSINVAQPPFMNLYGMDPVGTSYGMPGYADESS
ncbi:SafA/ExsA family spore coat assembly protein [Bacillus sp. BRMEA1]|nr:SafA/ExsA family spore coat assembly protein [Neobacillus endophyticus]NRD75973.1 SafA/ExsA family spore coat assembly protein [Neobacillus endophyticus]